MAATWGACLSGRMGAGDPLVVQDLAAAAGLSATPVREALAWLSGQGLVERRVGRGYFMVDPSAAEVAHLYELHHRCLLWALEYIGTAPGSPLNLLVSNPDERAALLFRSVAASSANLVLVDVQGRAAARLRLLRHAEQGFCVVDEDALSRAEAAFAEGGHAELRRFIDDHHRERRDAADNIAAALRKPVRNIEQI